jgi:NADH:ubiquinone oxidoreductase subunit H
MTLPTITAYCLGGFVGESFVTFVASCFFLGVIFFGGWYRHISVVVSIASLLKIGSEKD